MTDYNKLVEALQETSMDFGELDDVSVMLLDAANAIEDLEGFLAEAERDRDEYEYRMRKEQERVIELQAEVEKAAKRNAELHAELEKWVSAAEKAGEPKRGEWIKHPEVKNIYGGEYIECPFCGEKYVVQYIADEKFCRNCGADMRKMEAQDG